MPDPADARAAKRASTTAQAERYRRTAHVFAGIRFSAFGTSLKPCAAAAEMHGRMIDEPFILPLEACDRELCGCSWRGITARELRRQGS